MTCDQRLLAALYVAYNYQGEKLSACEPVAVGNGNAVVVVKVT